MSSLFLFALIIVKIFTILLNNKLSLLKNYQDICMVYRVNIF